MNKILIKAALVVAALTGFNSFSNAAAPNTFKFNNLTWTVPQAPKGMKDVMDWTQGDAYCKRMGARLPTKDELLALNRAAATPADWYVNVTMTSTPYGTDKHYTVFMGQLDGLGWSADKGVEGTAVVTCVK
jgi:hypothetical protein